MAAVAVSKRKRSTDPIFIDNDVSSYNDFTKDDISIIVEILSIFDNRHDFKPGSRNQSLTLNEVLSLLSDKSKEIHNKIDTLYRNDSAKKTLLKDLLNKHCQAEVSKYTRNTCKTTDKPDYQVEDYMIGTVFKEQLIYQRPTYDYTAGGDIEITNTASIRFPTKESLEEACGIKEDTHNPLLEKILNKLSQVTGKAPKEIRFCIDVSSVGEWVFHHSSKRMAETHLKTIVDDYDCFRINPNRSRLVHPFTLTKNHIALSNFTVTNDKITWNSPGRTGTLNLQRTTRAGVSIMAEAIRIVLDSKAKKARSEQAASELIKQIFQLPFIDISKHEYGKHIMDFKRLMDTTKLAVTMLYNQVSNYKVILVTHDHMLYLLAKTLQCPVILTIKNTDHSRELLFDIPVTLTSQQQAELKAKQTEKLKQIKTFWQTFPSILELTPYEREKLTQQVPELFKKLESNFIEYLLRLNTFFHNIQGQQITSNNLENLLQDITLYNKTITEFNTEYLTEIDKLNQTENPLATRINILLTILQPYSYVPDTSILKKDMIIFENKFKELRNEFQKPARFIPAQQTQTGRVIPLKYNATGLQVEPITKTKFLEQFKKTYTIGGTATNIASIADYAFDLLYKFIDKNIERYYSQPLHIQEQLMREAYISEVGQAPTDAALITYKKDKEALFQKYMEADQSGSKAASAPPVQPKQVTARVVSAPPVLPGQPYQTPMQVDARPKRGVKRTHRPVTHGPRGKIPMTVTQEEMLARMSEL